MQIVRCKTFCWVGEGKEDDDVGVAFKKRLTRTEKELPLFAENSSRDSNGRSERGKSEGDCASERWL